MGAKRNQLGLDVVSAEQPRSYAGPERQKLKAHEKMRRTLVVVVIALIALLVSFLLCPVTALQASTGTIIGSQISSATTPDIIATVPQGL